MIDEILQGAGLIKGRTYIQTVFKQPPSVPFAVYHDDADTSLSADETVNLIEHSIRLEFYAPNKPNPATEKAIERELKAHALHYRKEGRVWLESERYYMTIYEFYYIEKETTP
ncbi:MAG: hypothetical protein IJ598_08770 [Ruminococcus sp.]|nr:hypothetical protein [Ruminococcus sp.]